MKKLIVMLSLVLFLTCCIRPINATDEGSLTNDTEETQVTENQGGSDLEDSEVDNTITVIQERIDALPTVEEFDLLGDDEKPEVLLELDAISLLINDENKESLVLDKYNNLYNHVMSLNEEQGVDTYAEITVDSLEALNNAISNAQAGDTIKLTGNIENVNKSITISKNLILDLNGHTISGAIVSETSPIIVVGSSINLTVTDNSIEGEKGIIENTVTKNRDNASVIYLSSNSTLTLNGGISILLPNCTGNSVSRNAISGNNSSNTTVNVINAYMSVGTQYIFRAISNLTISGGTFKTEYDKTNSVYNLYCTSVKIKGGTFYSWKPSKDSKKIETGYAAFINTDSSISVKTMPQESDASISAYVEREGTKYYFSSTNLYDLMRGCGYFDIDGVIYVYHDASFSYPQNGTEYSIENGYGLLNDDGSVCTLTINVVNNAHIGGVLPLFNADVVINNGSGDFVVAANGYEITETVSEGTSITIKSRLTKSGTVATLTDSSGNTVKKFATLATAMRGLALNPGSTLTLQNDAEFDGIVSPGTSFSGIIGTAGEYTIDLNGHIFTCTTQHDIGSKDLVKIGTGVTLNIVDNSGKGGTLQAAKNNNPDYIIGTLEDSKNANIVIGEDVTIKGSVGICGNNATLDVNGTIDARGLTYVQGGTWSNYGIVTNGSGTVGSTVNINEGAEVYSDSHAIYHPGTGTLTVKSGATVSGGDVGIEMRSGTLNVEEGAVIIGGNGEPSSVDDESGTTSHNAAIAVAQHTTKNAITVNVKGGELSGGSTIYMTNPQNNDDTSISNVKVNITGGNFDGDVISNLSSNEEINKNSIDITKGVFTNDVSAYVNENVSNVANVKDSNGEVTKYICSDSTEEIIEAIYDTDNNGKTLTIEKLSSEIVADNVYSGITVANKSNNSVTINGVELSNGESSTDKNISTSIDVTVTKEGSDVTNANVISEDDKKVIALDVANAIQEIKNSSQYEETTKYSEDTYDSIKKLDGNSLFGIEVVINQGIYEENTGDRTIIIESLSRDEYCARYLDIQIQISVNDDYCGNLNELSQPITINYNDSGINFNSSSREYFINMVHNGVLFEDLEVVSTSRNIIGFKADKFSTYAICYKNKSTSSSTKPSSDPIDPCTERIGTGWVYDEAKGYCVYKGSGQMIPNTSVK